MKLRPVTVAAWLSLATAGVAFAGGTAASMQLSVVRFSPSLISMLAFSVVGAFVVTYRPGNRIGWLFCAIGLFWQVFWLSVTSTERPLAAGTLDVLDPLIWLPVNFWYVSTVLLEIRQQLKWFSYASLVFVGVFGALVLANAFPVIRTIDPAGRYPADLFGGVPFALALLLIPLSLGLAILRYRLYDIDVLIKRTVVYGVSSAAIAVLFFGGIVALQAVLGPLTSGSELAVAASTLVSFALFRPIRRRVRDGVDRRFDRSRYNAARTLDSSADQLRDEVDLATLRADVVAAARATMSPTHTSLWLREHLEPSAALPRADVAVTISGRLADRKELA